MSMKNQYLPVLLAFICIAGLVSGCIAQRPDPETGITAWISAVNNHDYNRVYDLAPEAIHEQINRSAFIFAQSDNKLLPPGNVIKGYSVIDKKVSANYAEITVQLNLHAAATQNASSEEIPVFIKFVEIFENGEWKVWTTSPM